MKYLKLRIFLFFVTLSLIIVMNIFINGIVFDEILITFMSGTALMLLYTFTRKIAAGLGNGKKTKSKKHVNAINLEYELNNTYVFQLEDNALFPVTAEKRLVWSFTLFFLFGLLLTLALNQIYGFAASVLAVIAINAKFKLDTNKWNYLDSNTTILGEKYPCQITEWGVKSEKGSFFKSYFLLCKYSYTRDNSTIKGIFRIEVPTLRFDPEESGTNIWLCKGDTAKFLTVEGLGRYKTARVMLRTKKEAFENMEMKDY
ncbi:MAG: hypothetical protein FWF94_06270 [Oscillospiraceae bacterium]|nr:hypothetical protein [Oscillospiraceae bacterium]